MKGEGGIVADFYFFHCGVQLGQIGGGEGADDDGQDGQKTHPHDQEGFRFSGGRR